MRGGGCFVFTPSHSIPSAQNFREIELELISQPMQNPVSSINIITAISSKLGDISVFKKHAPPHIPSTAAHAFIDLCNKPCPGLGNLMHARFLLNVRKGIFLSTPDTQIVKGYSSQPSGTQHPQIYLMAYAIVTASFRGLIATVS